jgi:hypothetical protein
VQVGEQTWPPNYGFTCTKHTQRAHGDTMYWVWDQGNIPASSREVYCNITECGNKTQLHWVPSRWLCIPPSFFSRKKLLLFIPPVCPFHRNACGRHQEVDKKDILAKRASAGTFLLHHLGTRPPENSIRVLLLCSPGGTEEVLLLLFGSSK